MAHPFGPLGAFFETIADIGAGASPTDRHRFRFTERAGDVRTAAAIGLTSLVAGGGTGAFLLNIADPSVSHMAALVASVGGFAVGLTVWLIDVATVEFVNRVKAEGELRWRGHDFLPGRARGLKLLSVLPLRGVQATITASLAGIGLALFIFGADVADKLAAEARAANAPVFAEARGSVIERVDALKKAYQRTSDAVTAAVAAPPPSSGTSGARTGMPQVEAASSTFDTRRHEFDTAMESLKSSLTAQIAITAEANARLSCEKDLISCDVTKIPVTGKRGNGPNAQKAAADARDSAAHEREIKAGIGALQQKIDVFEDERAKAMQAAQLRDAMAAEGTQQFDRAETVRRDKEIQDLRKAEADALAAWSTAKSTVDQDVAAASQLTQRLVEPQKGVTARLRALWQLRQEPGNTATFAGLTLLAMALELAPLITALLFAPRRFGPLLETIERERQILDELRKDEWRNRQ